MDLRSQSCRFDRVMLEAGGRRAVQVRAEDVYLPREAVFVIANSLAESQKAVTADRYSPPMPSRLASVSRAGQQQACKLNHNSLVSELWAAWSHITHPVASWRCSRHWLSPSPGVRGGLCRIRLKFAIMPAVASLHTYVLKCRSEYRRTIIV